MIDRVVRRWNADPGMHVYHYSPYEPAALKRLMGRYATGGTRSIGCCGRNASSISTASCASALRVGVERYSIKKLEPLYGFIRDVDRVEASRATAARGAGARSSAAATLHA